MGGWTAGKWISPAARARNATRDQVQVPVGYARALAVVLIGGAGLAALMVVLALLGIRVR